MIPFLKEENEEFDSRFVVRLIPEHVICFETKKRVPYRCVFETIEYFICKFFQHKRIGLLEVRQGGF